MLDRRRSAKAAVGTAVLLVATAGSAAAQGQPAAPTLQPAGVTAVEDPMLTPPPDPSRVIGSWDEALALVRNSTPEYLSALQDVLHAEAQAQLAVSQLLPTLMGSGTYTHQFVTETVSLSPTGASGASFVIPVPNVWAASANLNLPIVYIRGIYAQGTASRGVEAAVATFKDRKRQIAVSLVHTMLTTAAADRTAELNRVGLRAALERFALTRTKMRDQQGTQLDVERAERDVAVARSTLVTGDESLRQSQEALGAALGSGLPTSAKGSLDFQELERAVLRRCRISTDLEARPDVVAARRNVDVAERKVTDALLMLAPSLALQSQLAYQDQAVLAPNTTFFVEGVLSVPLFDGGVAIATARDARTLAEQARQTLARARLTALVNVAQSTRAVAVQVASRDLARTERDLARNIDLRTREGYLHGLGTSLDLVTSAQSLRQDEIGLAILEFQVAEARADALLANADCTY
jgi:multidrug efflux system outer membrane protein